MNRLIFIVSVACASLPTAGQAQTNGTPIISFQVRLDRDLPALPNVIVDKTPEICGSIVTDPVLTGRGRGVRNAVVYLETREPVTRRPVNTNELLSLRIERCLFSPRIQATGVGSTLHFTSSDATPHNPHGWHNDSATVFNLTLLDPKITFKRRLKASGLYRIDCDTHRWMRAYVWAFDHPYFAVTDDDGRAYITNVSKQHFVIKVWHEALGERSMDLGLVQTSTNLVFVFDTGDRRRADLKPTYSERWPPGKTP